MKIYTLEYSGESSFNWANLGDDIQSLVAKSLLPRVDGRISRENLTGNYEPGVLSMNGFLLGAGEWPPSDNLQPFFFSFHIEPGSVEKICSVEGVEYLKKHQPIGCRDIGTMEILQGYGVEAFYSRCITQTLPRRAAAPDNGKIYLVSLDPAEKQAVPKKIRKNSVVVDQAKVRIPGMGADIKESLSRGLLENYRNTASLVVTSKIHCAMPCIAMGIPVVFLYDLSKKDDYRVGLIEDLVPINYLGRRLIDRWIFNKIRSRKINWKPGLVEYESEKNKIRFSYLEAFARAVERFEKKYNEPEK